MNRTTLGQRLTAAMQRKSMSNADLARLAESTTATISNWMNDKVLPEHVKAAQLFPIANALDLSGHELLTGTLEPISAVQEARASYDSQAVKLAEWRIAFQLVAEALDDKGLTLPPPKRAEVTLLAYDLLSEGMPEAKVLRFVLAAAA